MHGSTENPERTPYVSTERYENPKDDFKTIGERLAELVDHDHPYEVADIGCANGELLYYLRRRFPHWRLTGFDREPRYLETARAFDGLRGVDFREADLYDIEGEYDIVLATCLLSLFPEIEPPLDKLLSLCRPGGLVLATGLFNPFDIEVRVQFRDDSGPDGPGAWRTDFNRHSQRRVRERYGPSVQWLEFGNCTYDVELEHEPDNPIRVWTVRTVDGRTLLVNGAWQIANQVLLTIRR